MIFGHNFNYCVASVKHNVTNLINLIDIKNLFQHKFEIKNEFQKFMKLNIKLLISYEITDLNTDNVLKPATLSN